MKHRRSSRETWVDAVKVLACILVVLGHFFQSMTKANIIEQTVLYTWFNRTIYYFHVPLFFLCSGYLYQRGKPEKGNYDHYQLVLKKLLGLGVPFVVFSLANWLLKAMFASAVNTQANSLVTDLFIRPAAPYWYLYTLFFIFLITPAINSKISACVIAGLAIAAQGVSLFFKNFGIYALDTMLANWLWFVLGMILCFTDSPKLLRKQKGAKEMGLAIFVLFFAGSIAVVMRQVSHSLLSFLFGLIACSGIVVMAVNIKFSENAKKIIRWLSDYTLPIYLMHTIFAAAFRSLLLKLGITNAAVHIVAGLVISFGGPILVGFVFKKLKWPEFILYPGKFIKIKSKKEVSSHGEKA